MPCGPIANDKLAGSIANAKLANSSITIDAQSVALKVQSQQLTLNLHRNVEDIGLRMLDTETYISVSYDDTNGNLDFVVADSDFELTDDVTKYQSRRLQNNVSIATTIAANSVALNRYNSNYIAAVSAEPVSVSAVKATSTVSIGEQLNI